MPDEHKTMHIASTPSNADESYLQGVFFNGDGACELAVIGVDYAKTGSDCTIEWSQQDDVTTWSHHAECKCSDCAGYRIKAAIRKE